jgi:hypothetical protein
MLLLLLLLMLMMMNHSFAAIASELGAVTWATC